MPESPAPGFSGRASFQRLISKPQSCHQSLIPHPLTLRRIPQPETARQVSLGVLHQTRPRAGGKCGGMPLLTRAPSVLLGPTNVLGTTQDSELRPLQSLIPHPCFLNVEMLQVSMGVLYQARPRTGGKRGGVALLARAPGLPVLALPADLLPLPARKCMPPKRERERAREEEGECERARETARERERERSSMMHSSLF